MKYHDRLSLIQKRLRRKKVDAILVGQPENRRYLSGYTAEDHGIAETSGMLLIPARGRPYLLTDFRFYEQAEEEALGYTIVLYPKGLLALLKKLLPDLGIKTVAFEADYTLFSTAEKLYDLGKTLDIDFIPLQGLVERLRLVKSEKEIQRIKKSVILNEKVFQSVYNTIQPGMSEIEIAMAIAAEMRILGAERESFETIVASDAASSLPHAVPTKRKTTKNSIILIDMGLILRGYCSDMTRTFCLGRPTKKYLKIHRIVRKAMRAGIAAVREGVTGKQVDQAARKVIADAGYGKYFGHALGHGVGLAVHENPRISKRGTRKLKKNMVITIEPGIYIPGWGGVRLENMVVVRKEHGEELNRDTTWLDI